MPLHCISSMATRQLLARLIDSFEQASGIAVVLESIGGVDAARRVASGEVFDVVVLAEESLRRLSAAGHVVAGSTRAIAVSDVAIAVPAGAKPLRVASEDALASRLLKSAAIGYSTGPSGTALLAVLDRLGVRERLAHQLVQAPAGVPVADLLARGIVDIGFQQRSELMHAQGLVLGAMPAGLEITTTFSAALCSASSQADAARRLVDHLCSAQTDAVKRSEGMSPP